MPSRIAFQIAADWVEGGSTDESGVFRHRPGCRGALFIRAIPYNRSYFPSTGQACQGRVVIIVRRRNDPILAILSEHDADGDRRLNRTEFVTFLAAANALESIPEEEQNSRSVTTEATSWFSPSWNFILVNEVRLAQNSRHVTAHPFGGEPIDLPNNYWQPLSLTLGLTEPTIRSPEGDGSRAILQVRRLALRTGESLGSPLIEALNETSAAFLRLDVNQDGFLTEDEVAVISR